MFAREQTNNDINHILKNNYFALFGTSQQTENSLQQA